MRLPVLLFAACWPAGCSASPTHGDHDPRTSAARITAVDMGLSSSARRLDNLTQRLRGMPSELDRIGNLTKSTGMVDRGVKRLADLPDAAVALTSHELMRRPHIAAGLVPTPAAYSQDLADDLSMTIELLGGAHHPLGEIDDRRHRTSPADDHEEASWWQRICRRLRL